MDVMQSNITTQEKVEWLYNNVKFQPNEYFWIEKSLQGYVVWHGSDDLVQECVCAIFYGNRAEHVMERVFSMCVVENNTQKMLIVNRLKNLVDKRFSNHYKPQTQNRKNLWKMLADVLFFRYK